MGSWYFGSHKNKGLSVQFENFAATYTDACVDALGPFHKKKDFFDRVKVFYMKRWLGIQDSKPYQILDFGCGTGKLTRFLAKGFKKSTIYAYDISESLLEKAKEVNRQYPNVKFINEFGEKNKFDFIIIVNVFHHIKPRLRNRTFEHIKALLKPNGKVIVYEHNPYNPLTQRVVATCPFDTDANLLTKNHFLKIARACKFNIDFASYVLYFPWDAMLFRSCERWLQWLPLGAQYLLVLTDNLRK